MHHRRAWFAAGVVIALPLAAAAQRPAAVPAEVRAACDRLVSDVMTKTPGTRVRRTTGTFRDELLRAPVAGCRVETTGSFKQLGNAKMPAERLRDVFDAHGWKELPEFSADGHDGTSFAYAASEAACLARGAWDGGSDDEPDAPPSDPYRVTVICGRTADFVR